MAESCTPVELHYLNKSLVALHLDEGLSALSEIGTTAGYGSPFLPHPVGPNSKELFNLESSNINTEGGGFLSIITSLLGSAEEVKESDWKDFKWKNEKENRGSILKYCFRRFFLKFPALRLAPPTFWSDQVQIFVDSFCERNLSDGEERAEITKRKLLASGLARLGATAIATALSPEVRTSVKRPTKEMMNRVDKLQKGEEWKEMGVRSKEIRSAWVQYRRGLVNGVELSKSVALIRTHPSISSLPLPYKLACEATRNWVANALHFVFCNSPSSAEIVNLATQMHGLIPYTALRLGLRAVNPTVAIKICTSILLGQIGGLPSLFQTIFSIIINSNVRQQQKIINELSLGMDQKLVEALKNYMNSKFTEREKLKSTKRVKEDLILVIIRQYAGEEQAKIVKSWNLESNEKWWTLKNLLQAIAIKRDREQVLELVMELNTPQLLHESIRIFYKTIYNLAQASNLADRLRDFELFVDDLLKICNSEKNPSPSQFFNVCQKHEEQLFIFAKELVAHPGLLDSILEWCADVLNFLKVGVKEDKEKVGVEIDYDEMLKTVSVEEREEILSEMKDLATWTMYKKIELDITLRVDLLAASSLSSSTSFPSATSLFDEFTKHDKVFQEYMKRRGTSESEDSVSWAYFSPKTERLSTSPSSSKGSEKTNFSPPKLIATRLLLKLYSEEIGKVLNGKS